MSVKFSKSGADVLIQNPDVNDVWTVRKQQVAAERSDGKLYRYRLASGTLYDRELRWSELRRSERDALSYFFVSLADGVLNDFTFTDERGVTWNAHFMDSDLEITTVADATASASRFTSGAVSYPTTTRSGGVYAVTVRLRLWAVT